MAEVEELYSILKEKLMKSELEETISITTTSDLPKLDLALLKFFIQDNAMSGIITCINRPHTYYAKLLSANGMNPEDLYYVDACSPLLHTPSEAFFLDTDKPERNVWFVRDISDLSFLQIEIYEVAKRLINASKSKRGFLLVDGLASLGLYNDPTSLGKFLHDLSIRARSFHIYMVLIMEKDEALANLIRTICDNNYQF
ncbi:MAG: hypothetical protein NT130_02160 [Candidatus Micrarchaeota archaeon]|nr:hypothetical protein [Candidatus Micrarchaeota archaeon]